MLSYLIIYDKENDYAIDLDKTNNIYLTLDLDIIGNINNQTSHLYLHLDKCGLEIDKNMYFEQNSNAIDLIFKIINDSNSHNYLTLK